MVEVYKTNVTEIYHANYLLQKIYENFKDYSANFDLEDCDKILRIESDKMIDSMALIHLFNTFNFSLEILPDIINS
jgi:hypothetical protein